MTRDFSYYYLILFVGIATSHIYLEPAYIGYIVCALGFSALSVSKILSYRGENSNYLVISAILFCVFFMSITMAILEEGDPRDIFRDIGALFAFMFGLVIIPRASRSEWVFTLVSALSKLGVLISIWTFLGAAVAYLSGAGAYEWRGVFVPFAHLWLPYLLIVEYMLMQKSKNKRGSLIRMMLCVFATLVSLSRTGLALIIIFALGQLFSHWRAWLSSGKSIVRLLLVGGAVVAVVPLVLNLDVAQTRIEAGVGEADLSAGWRTMENTAAIDMLNDGGAVHWLVGFGLGARVPLPPGIVDFNGEYSIPHLHNSFVTIIVKTGLLGLFSILMALAYIVWRARRLLGTSEQYRWFGGVWMLFFVLGYAYTLQGLTSWSHLIFLGIACALLIDKAPTTQMIFPSRKPEHSRNISSRINA
jgi:O-antigen ligase